MNITLNMHTQNGAALIVGMIVLLIMTLLGVTSMSISTSQLKASSNMQTQNLAIQAAETASSVLMDSNSSVVTWTIATPQSFTHSDFFPDGINTSVDITTLPAGGSLDVSAEVTYQNCSKVTLGNDLSNTGQDSESLFNGMVHDVAVNAVVLSTLGTQNGATQRLRGVQTMVVKCDKT